MTTQNERESAESKIIARALKDEVFKQALPLDFNINVVQETLNTAYIVLPYMPSTEGLTQ